jgi:hypothetical protein
MVIAMLLSGLQGAPLIRAFFRWWRRCDLQNAAVAELSNLGSEEIGRVARDVGVSSAELRTLAGKWPDSAELLSRRLIQLNLDEKILRRQAPQVLRDMQRVCTLCASKRQCERDFAYRSSDASWRAYCPNSQTLAALEIKHGEKAEPTAA